jgi:hypothetical protein
MSLTITDTEHAELEASIARMGIIIPKNYWMIFLKVS